MKRDKRPNRNPTSIVSSQGARTKVKSGSKSRYEGKRCSDASLFLLGGIEMGGRGASSGKKGRSNGGSGSSIEKLTARIERLQKREEKLEAQQRAIYRASWNPFKLRMEENAYQKWLKLGDQQRAFRKKRAELTEKRAELRRQAEEKNQSPKKKLNGYGEATSRDITSTTYDRAQRRLQRDVANFIGRNR